MQEPDAFKPAAADANEANEAPAALVLVRDSISLKPRLLQPSLAYDHPASKTTRTRKPIDAINQASDDAQRLLAEERELKYFTDVSAQGLETGFAAACRVPQQGADAAGLHSPGGVPATDKATVRTGAADGWAVGLRSAAELEMQQVEELRQRRGGILAPEELEVVQVWILLGTQSALHRHTLCIHMPYPAVEAGVCLGATL